MPRTIAPASLQPAASSRPASDADDDNTRVLQRVEAAVADPSGRLRLLLDNTNATSLPGFELAQLRGTLRELDCSNSPRLASLPMEIGHCFRTLTALNCSRCALTALPDEVGLLAHLAHLDCSYNRLETFVWDCRALARLTKVVLSHNRLKCLSPSAAEALLLTCTAVDLSGNDETLREIMDKQIDPAALLPPHVSACSVCGKESAGGAPPKVYVQFLPWRPAGKGKDPRGAAMEERALVPVIHPCCGADCAQSLYRWQSMLKE
jgi:hypothetical protein